MLLMISFVSAKYYHFPFLYSWMLSHTGVKAPRALALSSIRVTKQNVTVDTHTAVYKDKNSSVRIFNAGVLAIENKCCATLRIEL